MSDGNQVGSGESSLGSIRSLAGRRSRGAACDVISSLWLGNGAWAVHGIVCTTPGACPNRRRRQPPARHEHKPYRQHRQHRLRCKVCNAPV
jgi:hypothetical protein